MTDETATRSGMSSPSRREFIRGGSALGLGAAAAGLAGCGAADTSATDRSGAADKTNERPLFNGVSAKSSEIYPFAFKALEINGRRIHYVDEGSGPTVMLVHGQGNWSYHFRGVIARLKGRARVVCHDHFGSGLSDKPAFHRQYTIENPISTLYGVIKALDLRGITFYCMDWGGPISFAYAMLTLGAGVQPVAATRVSTDHLELTAYASDAFVAPGARFSLVVSVSPRPGMHVYAPGAAGYRVVTLPLSWELALTPTRQ